MFALVRLCWVESNKNPAIVVCTYKNLFSPIREHLVTEHPDLVCNSLRKLIGIQMFLHGLFQGHRMTNMIASVSHDLCILSNRKEKWGKRTFSVLKVPYNTYDNK